MFFRRCTLLVTFVLLQILTLNVFAQEDDNDGYPIIKHCLEFELGGKFGPGLGATYSLGFGDIWSLGGGVGGCINPRVFTSQRYYFYCFPIFITITPANGKRVEPIFDLSTTFTDSENQFFSGAMGVRYNVNNLMLKLQVHLTHFSETANSGATFPFIGIGAGVKL